MPALVPCRQCTALPPVFANANNCDIVVCTSSSRVHGAPGPRDPRSCHDVSDRSDQQDGRRSRVPGCRYVRPRCRPTPTSGSRCGTWPCPRCAVRSATFEGTLELAERPEDSKVSVTIEAGSVETRDENRDNHLRTNDFFDVENHPTWTFVSTAIKPVTASSWKVEGDLTIRGVTRSVTLDADARGCREGSLRDAPGRVQRHHQHQPGGLRCGLRCGHGGRRAGRGQERSTSRSRPRPRCRPDRHRVVQRRRP